MTFQIVKESYKTNEKFKVARRTVSFKLSEIPDNVEDPETWVKNGIEAITAHIKTEVDPDDKIGFTFTSEGFSRKGEAHLSFRKAGEVTFEDVWGMLGKLYQSNSEGFHSDTFRMVMTQVKPHRGSRRVATYTTYEEACARQRGIVSIVNADNLCLPRALVVAIAYAVDNPFAVQIRRNTRKMQDEATKKLLQEAGIQIPEDGATMEEVRLFQSHLKAFKITVYAYGSKGRTVLFEGPDAPQKLNLLHHDNHFNVITNLKAAFCCSYYCESCHVPYDHKNHHRCTASCPCCQQSPPCEKTGHEITCNDCHRSFRGLECYNKHKVEGSHGKVAVCEQVKRCSDCLKTVPSNRQHICNEVYCKICKKHQPAGHFCHIQPDTRSPSLDKTLFIFYDLESRQDEEGVNGEKIHVPNLCVFQQRCSECMDMDNSVTVCSVCCVRRQVLKLNPVETFITYVLGVRKAYKRVVVIAHNGKAYDHQFLLKHVLECTDLKADVIMRGTSITMMGIDNVKFIDSINYFPMALAALPKAFDLGPEMKKGYFPHLFNTLPNANYDGPLPDLKYYDPDQMSEDNRLKLLEWHEAHKDNNFNMQRDLVEYCISDVDILTKACLKFRKIFLMECNVCPFTEAVTIASACNLVYRRNFLKPETIGIIPRNGYRNTDQQSKIATLWLIYEEWQRGINIIHAAKQREALVAGVKVDGYCEETNQIFEFHGCYFHGHTCIGGAKRDEPTRDDPADTLSSRFERTIKKTDRLKQLGYDVIEMWECEFRAFLQKNPALTREIENHPLMSCLPLDPRDSFYGGRTGNCSTYYQIQGEEKIKYVDVCSLYPWVCKYGKYPIGHPKVHVGDACSKIDVNHTNGLIKCKILPPQQLYHHVLPQKMNKKLMFVLCRTCGTTMNQGECCHTDEQRALTGIWVIDEVRKALEKGYTMLQV